MQWKPIYEKRSGLFKSVTNNDNTYHYSQNNDIRIEKICLELIWQVFMSTMHSNLPEVTRYLPNDSYWNLKTSGLHFRQSSRLLKRPLPGCKAIWPRVLLGGCLPGCQCQRASPPVLRGGQKSTTSSKTFFHGLRRVLGVRGVPVKLCSQFGQWEAPSFNQACTRWVRVSGWGGSLFGLY